MHAAAEEKMRKLPIFCRNASNAARVDQPLSTKAKYNGKQGRPIKALDSRSSKIRKTSVANLINILRS